MSPTGPWTDEELRQLEDPDEWDWDNAVVVHPTGKPGAVVAVRFDAAEFEQISAQADALGEKLTEFIHRASLERARTGGKRSGAKAPASKKKVVGPAKG